MKYRFLFTLLLICVVAFQNGHCQTNVTVNPNTKYQTIEGWGGSLCWWAVMVGGFSEAKVNEVCNMIASPNELNMNVFRYNIGGGENPAHNHMRAGGEVPGFKTSATAPYDWTQDANQIKILTKLNALRKDALLEAFSNSPPHWMTKSGCTAGNTDGSDNLRDDQYAAFADYFTTVVKHFKDDLGITFQTIDPFNEPFSSWWKLNNNQEGCRFSQANQHKLILEVHKSLTAKNMLGYTGISAMDASSLDEALNGINGYVAAGNIMSKIVQINSHSYSGSRRTELYNLARAQNKPLWQSETGPLGLNASGIASNLLVAQRLITDLRNLKPVVWLDWQLTANNEPSWSLINTVYNSQAVSKHKAYYIRMQCSRFIKQGYTIIATNLVNTVAAINPAGTEVVLVVCNESASAQPLALDLSGFLSVSTPVVYRTSGSENCVQTTAPAVANKRITYSAPGTSVTTFVIPVTTTVTSVEENTEGSNNNVTCSPNPFTHEIFITNARKFDYAAYTLDGKEIEKGSGENEIIVGNNWPAGMYIIRVTAGEVNKHFKVSKH